MRIKILLLVTVVAVACNHSKIRISERAFGDFEGKPVKEYTLRNANGMQVSIINYGGTITKIITPDSEGKMGDVVLGFESLEGYLQKGNPYFGSLIGRFGNRIAKAKFTLDGKDYVLAGNDHGNSLHGGNRGFDKVYWDIKKMPGDSSLELSYLSKDGEEGYPGNLTVTVIYTLTAANELKIDYTASSDKVTIVNLTNHAYFNLGKDSTILNYELQISADAYTPVDSLLIPTGEILPVKGTAMDFTRTRKIAKGGYDHNWVLNKNDIEIEKIASLYDPRSGRMMEVFTTEPGLQFYSGNFLDGTLTDTKGGMKYVKHAGLCLETQHFPDSPHQPGFPTTILRAGETYRQTTIYKFSTR